MHDYVVIPTFSHHSLGRKLSSTLLVQQLMEHPFLRPSASPVPGLVGLTRTQLKKLLAQLSSVSGSDEQQDIELLSEELFKQLSAGESVDLQALICKPKSKARDTFAEHTHGMLSDCNVLNGP